MTLPDQLLYNTIAEDEEVACMHVLILRNGECRFVSKNIKLIEYLHIRILSIANRRQSKKDLAYLFTLFHSIVIANVSHIMSYVEFHHTGLPHLFPIALHLDPLADQ